NNVNFDEAVQASWASARAVFGLLGTMYKKELEDINSKLPPTEQKSGFFFGTVSDHYKPSQINAEGIFSAGDNNPVLDSDNVISGYFITRNYPDLHYAVAKGVIESGTLGNPEMLAIMKNYTDTVEKFMPQYADTYLAQEVTQKILAEVESAQKAAADAA